jgi:gas vesicle protein GvpN
LQQARRRLQEFGGASPEAPMRLAEATRRRTELEERLLDLQATGGDTNYVRVDPAFNAIFTSNPGDYAGVHRSQDALLDRMVTIDLDHFDEETEIAITQARAQVGQAEARRMVASRRCWKSADGGGSAATTG